MAISWPPPFCERGRGGDGDEQFEGQTVAPSCLCMWLTPAKVSVGANDARTKTEAMAAPKRAHTSAQAEGADGG